MLADIISKPFFVEQQLLNEYCISSITLIDDIKKRHNVIIPNVSQVNDITNLKNKDIVILLPFKYFLTAFHEKKSDTFFYNARQYYQKCLIHNIPLKVCSFASSVDELRTYYELVYFVNEFLDIEESVARKLCELNMLD